MGQYIFIDSTQIYNLGLPIGIGLVIAIALYFIRLFLYRRLQLWAKKTRTCLDDIFIRDTRLVSILWCLWIGIFTGYRIAHTPSAWVDMENQVIPVAFVALGVYTVVVLLMVFLKWYKSEICGKTFSNLDDVIMSFLIVCTPVVGVLIGTYLILKMLGIESDAVNTWVTAHFARVTFLVTLMVVLLLISIFFVPRIVQNALKNSRSEQTEEELKKRSDTLVGVIGTTVQLVIGFIFMLMILSEFSINIVAFLTGASILGVAVGFGAQYLVKDIISGLFVIVENQYRKGDVVKIADVSGVVEEINLRRTILRDMDGITHVVPNGEIRIASNYTKQWSRVNLNISVSYNTDLDHAIKVINRVGKEMAEDPVWAPDLISAPQALRVDKLGDSGIDIKILGDTKPVKQWAVMGELRLRLKKAFDEEGIEIPWPHTKVYFGDFPPELLPPRTQPGNERIKDKDNK